MSVNVPISADINQGSFEAIRKGLVDIARQAGLSEKEIEDMNRQIDEGAKKSKRASQETSKGINEIKNVAKTAGQALVATFSVQLLIQFQKHIFNITAEFQKMEAVLTNSLGSKSAAQLAMRQILDFAAKTPFQVGQITEAYIKLVNRGFKPTMREMRQMGDLSSSLGKDLDQLVEALLDAQTGEFERLKEFGIRASKEGDNVKFTFKGVQTQVEFTEKAIQNYVLSLGDVEGVSGSMAAISETVAGKVSNIGDNIDQLSKAIGDRQSGVYAATLDWLNDFLSLATLAAQSTYDLWLATRQLNQAESIQATKDEVDGLIAKLGEQMDAQEAINRAIDLTIQSYKNLEDDIDPTGRGITQEDIDAQTKALEEYRVVLLNTLEKENERGKGKEEKSKKEIEALGLIGRLEKEISELQKKRNQVETTNEIALIDARIAKRREEIAVINLMAGEIDSPETADPFAGGLGSATEEAVKRQKKAFEESVKNATKWMEDTKNITQEVKSFWRDWSDSISWTALDTYMNIEELGRMNTKAEISRLEDEKARKQELAGQDKEQQILIEEEFQAKKEALRAKERARMIREAIAQRALSLFNIFRNTTEAAAAALAPPPIGYGPVAGIAAATGIKIFGVLQAASVLSQPLPKFAKGVFNLEGPGTGTSDSIHAMLSRGESVVPASKSAMFKDVVQPMIEDQHFNYEKLLGIALDKVDPRLRGDLFRTGKTQGGSGVMLQELRSIKEAIKSQKGASILIDKTGVSMAEKKRNRVIKQSTHFLYG